MIDTVVTLSFVAAAVGFLLWNLTSREHKPACHVVAGPGGARVDAGAGGGDVVVGPALARGLAKARSSAGEKSAAAETLQPGKPSSGCGCLPADPQRITG